MAVIEVEKLIDKQVILITNNGMRYAGQIIDCGSLFITFKEENKKNSILLNVATIDKIIEVKQ